jgi:hypothetical protein
MSTVPRRHTHVKPAVEATLWPFSQTSEAVLDIDRGGDAFHYWLTPLPSDFGRAFRLTKFLHQGGEQYDVLLDGDQSTCECLGHLRWQTPCKHISALLQLDLAGRLPTPPKPAYRSTADFAANDPEGYEAMMAAFPERTWPAAEDEAEVERRYCGE